MKRFNNISLYRIIATICILQFHIFYILYPRAIPYEMLLSKGVQGLTALSGFLYSQKLISDYKKFYKNNLVKLLIPAGICLLFMFSWNFIYMLITKNWDYMLFLTHRAYIGRIITQADNYYYLAYIIVCYAITPLLQRCDKWSNVTVMSVILAEIAIAFFNGTAMILVSYLAGYYIGKKCFKTFTDIEEKYSVPTLIIWIGVLLAALGLYIVGNEVSFGEAYYLTRLQSTVKNISATTFGVATLFVFLISLKFLNKYNSPSLFKFTDRLSLIIYLLNQAFMTGAMSVTLYAKQMWLITILIYVLTIGSSVGILFICDNIFKGLSTNGKPRKSLIVAFCVVVSTAVTYFGGGLIAMNILEDQFVNQRYSDISELEKNDFYKIQKVRMDYPLLQEREVIEFTSKGETLKGYFYEVNSPKGVIIIAHGVNNMADGNGAQIQNYFVEHNWDVFAIDLTGCGRSSGKGIKTLHESRYCLLNAVKTMQNYDKAKGLPLFLIGHSWGAYGSVAATEDCDGVSAVVSFSGYNSPYDMMYGFAENNSSKGVILTRPTMELSLLAVAGSDSFFTAKTAIEHKPDVDYIIVQGELDDVVPLKRYSIYDNIKDSGYSNVTAIKLEGMNHSSPWKTLEAETYTRALDKELGELRKQYHGNIPDDIHQQFLDAVDKEKSSALNTELLGQIENIFISKFA